jgi:hypothetical protein
VCRVSGDGIDTYVIVDAFPTRYIPGEESNPLASLVGLERVALDVPSLSEVLDGD